MSLFRRFRILIHHPNISTEEEQGEGVSNRRVMGWNTGVGKVLIVLVIRHEESFLGWDGLFGGEVLVFDFGEFDHFG